VIVLKTMSLIRSGCSAIFTSILNLASSISSTVSLFISIIPCFNFMSKLPQPSIFLDIRVKKEGEINEFQRIVQSPE